MLSHCATVNWNAAVAIGFSTATDYRNVEIGITVVSFGGPGDIDLQAFLTDRLGPGTTSSNQVAAHVGRFAIPQSPLSAPCLLTPIVILRGLTLRAGHYFLSFTGSVNGGDVSAISSPSQSAVSRRTGGATVTQGLLLARTPSAYVPASTFAAIAGSNLWISVLGAPVGAARKRRRTGVHGAGTTASPGAPTSVSG